jgi:hypothetical protein
MFIAFNHLKATKAGEEVMIMAVCVGAARVRGSRAGALMRTGSYSVIVPRRKSAFSIRSRSDLRSYPAMVTVGIPARRRTGR